MSRHITIEDGNVVQLRAMPLREQLIRSIRALDTKDLGEAICNIGSALTVIGTDVIMDHQRPTDNTLVSVEQSCRAVEAWARSMREASPAVDLPSDTEPA